MHFNIHAVPMTVMQLKHCIGAIKGMKWGSAVMVTREDTIPVSGALYLMSVTKHPLAASGTTLKWQNCRMRSAAVLLNMPDHMATSLAMADHTICKPLRRDANSTRFPLSIAMIGSFLVLSSTAAATFS